MATALENLDSGIRSATVTNLVVEHGPEVSAAIPLLSKAFKDRSPRVRDLAHGALERLGQGLSADEARDLADHLLDSPGELAVRSLLLAYYNLGSGNFGSGPAPAN
ncbi:hypothetical protein [Posidoniimonas corsicana]|nr:hypothetical protein [Posidoniimonas corsicana]